MKESNEWMNEWKNLLKANTNGNGGWCLVLWPLFFVLILKRKPEPSLVSSVLNELFYILYIKRTQFVAGTLRKFRACFFLSSLFCFCLMSVQRNGYIFALNWTSVMWNGWMNSWCYVVSGYLQIRSFSNIVEMRSQSWSILFCTTSSQWILWKSKNVFVAFHMLTEPFTIFVCCAAIINRIYGNKNWEKDQFMNSFALKNELLTHIIYHSQVSSIHISWNTLGISNFFLCKEKRFKTIFKHLLNIAVI